MLVSRTLRILILATLVLASLPRTAANAQCEEGHLVVRVVDFVGADVADAKLELRRLEDGALVVPTGPWTADVGIRFVCLKRGRYEVVASYPAWPAKTVVVTVGPDSPATTLVIELGIPCDQETGKAIKLTDEDRRVILVDLVAHALERSDFTVLVDENIEPLKRSGNVPSHLLVLSERSLLKLSKRTHSRFLRVSRLQVKGQCVVADYWIGFAFRGQTSGVCCMGETYTYRHSGGKWQGQYFSGMISRSTLRHPTSACSGARAARSSLCP